MPGCTAPNCTNSSQKGFKLYHFPSDKERSFIWVQNCGRERGWKPTKHTCVCEVHFEESQFESHRADGLRKLKPNAIPTIFNRVAPLRSYTRKAKKEPNNENVCPVTKENRKLPKVAEGTRLKVTSQQKGFELKESTGKDSDGPLQGEGEGLKELDHTYPKFTSGEDKDQNILNNDVTVEDGEVSVTVSLPTQCSKSYIRGRKRGRPVRKCDKKYDGEWCPEKSRTSRGRKRGRPPGSSNKSPASFHSPVRKSVKFSIRNKEQLQDSDKGIVKEDCPTSENKTGDSLSGEKSQCFVCDKNVNNGISIHTLTNTTKVHMHHKLDKLVVGEMELRIGEDGVLCIRCANLLNYVDRIEVELNMLTKAILNSIRKKYGMGVRTSDKTLENLLSDIEEEEKDEQGNCGEKINMDLQLSLGEETSNQWTEHENGSVVSSYTSDTLDASATNKIHESPPSEEMQCHVCRFRTSYKSLMIFHLRQHMKDSYWCDFCNIPLPKGTVDWMGRNSVENHITNIDLDDQHVIADVQGDIVEQEVEANGNAVREVDGSDTSILPRSMDLMVTVLPVSAEVVGKIVPQKVIRSERIKSRRGTEDTVRLPNDNDKSSSSLNHMQSISNSGKCIRVLNEMGMIITQEVASSDEVKDSETVVSEEHTDSQIPSHTVKFTTLDLTVKPQAGDRSKDQDILCKYLVDSHSNKGSAITELELNMEHRQLLNEVAITEVTSEELQIDNLSGDASEMRVNVTPGMMTYSSHDRRLNAALVDNPSELNEEVVGVQN